MRDRTEAQIQQALHLMQDALQEAFLTLRVDRIELRESFTEDRCDVSFEVVESPSGVRAQVDASGVGIVDAFFQGLKRRYATENPSLQSLRFSRFHVRGAVSEQHNSDARAEAEVGILNSYGTEFVFRAESPSVNRSSLEAVLGAVEFFVNSERAYVTLYRAWEHAKKGGRSDLVARYTDQLGRMVQNTSYSEVLQRLDGINAG
jgi:hypothetical protein